MNWGYKIMFVYLGFVAFILTLVFFSYSINIDLVAKDYYKQELAYEKEIDKIRNTQALSHQPELSYHAENHALILTLNNRADKGSILLFRPSDKRKDIQIPLVLDNQGRQVIPLQTLAQGLWRIKVDWTLGNKGYFLEQKFAITPQGKVKLQAELLKEEQAKKQKR
ncbi:MAG: FixH family protein [Microscillaceae bacterium]|nr:FixH family protein [Microscillaceae bacterium]MDW8460109.1 FixH family protein [Cytophagales bacterium]